MPENTYQIQDEHLMLAQLERQKMVEVLEEEVEEVLLKKGSHQTF